MTITVVTCANCGAKNRVDDSRTADAVCGKCHSPLHIEAAADHVVELTDQTIGSFLSRAGSTPVLVDCWAPWCGPCRMLAPTLDHLAEIAHGRWIIGKLNVDENPSTASQFNISSIPAMLLFKDGNLLDQLVGLQPRNVIEARLLAAR